VWVIGTAAFALTVNFDVGMVLMLAPTADPFRWWILELISSVSAIHERIRGER
jgi:hypothetical protein